MRMWLSAGTALALVLAAGAAMAQEAPAAPAPRPANTPDAVVTEEVAAAAADAEALLSDDELDALVAPVALYPDSLLTQVLVASTYPLDLVKADRFITAKADLSDKDRKTAAEQEDWDPSVQVLAGGFPTVVQKMATEIDWTQDLGDAMLAQSDDVLDAVQRQRARAVAIGNLSTNEAQVVDQADDTISIDSADPDVVYVPQYDATTAYTTPYTEPAVVAAHRHGLFDRQPARDRGDRLRQRAADQRDLRTTTTTGTTTGTGRPISTGTMPTSTHGANIDVNGDVNIDRSRNNAIVAGGDRANIDRTRIGDGNDRPQRRLEAVGEEPGRCARTNRQPRDQARRRVRCRGPGQGRGARRQQGAVEQRRRREAGQPQAAARQEGQAIGIHLARHRRRRDEDPQGHRPRRSQREQGQGQARGQGPAEGREPELLGAQGSGAKAGREIVGLQAVRRRPQGERGQVARQPEQRRRRWTRRRRWWWSDVAADAVRKVGAMTMVSLPNSWRGGLVALLLASAAPMIARAEPETFATPEAATDAVIAAVKAKDPKALLAIFGPESKDVIFTGDEASDREDWRNFYASYEALHRIVVEPTESGGDEATLYIGRTSGRSRSSWSRPTASGTSTPRPPRRRSGCGGSGRTSST